MVFRGNGVGISRHLQSTWVEGRGSTTESWLLINCQTRGVIRIFQSLRGGSVKLCRNTTKLLLRKINIA